MASSSNSTRNGLSSFTATSCRFIPIKENTNTTLFSLGIMNLKFPSISVAVPTIDPFNKTATPGKGSPFLSVTRPDNTIFSFPTLSVFFLITIDCISNLYSKGEPSNSFAKAASTETFRTFKVTLFIAFNWSALYTKFRFVCSLICLNTICTSTSFTLIVTFCF